MAYSVTIQGSRIALRSRSRRPLLESYVIGLGRMSWIFFIALILVAATMLLDLFTDLVLGLAPALNWAARRFGLQRASATGEEYVGKKVVVLKTCGPAGARGKIELNGTCWSAKLSPRYDNIEVVPGSYVIIEGLEGLTFLVVPKVET